MKQVFGKIAFVWFALVFISVFLLLYPIFLVLLSRKSLYPYANALRKMWAWITLILCFSIPRIRGYKSGFPKPSIFVSNHTSYMDIIVLGIFAPLKVSFIAKKELAKIPLFGIFFRTIDIAVDRKSIRDSYQSLAKAKERLEEGYSVIIFPEGTIWEKTPQLKPFKNGAFKLAIEGKYPLIPVTFFNNYKALPDEKFEFYPRILECKVHRPILTDHLITDDSDKLKDDIYTLIKNDLIEKKVL